MPDPAGGAPIRAQTADMNIPKEWARRLRLKMISSMNERSERAEDKLLELELSEKVVELAIALRSYEPLPPIPRFPGV